VKETSQTEETHSLTIARGITELLLTVNIKLM